MGSPTIYKEFTPAKKTKNFTFSPQKPGLSLHLVETEEQPLMHQSTAKFADKQPLVSLDKMTQ